MANGILVLAEFEGGRFKKTAYELLTKARELAAGATVSALAVGTEQAHDLGAFGAATVYVVPGDRMARYNPGTWANAIVAAIHAAQPAAVLAPASANCRDAFPRVAARLGLGYVTEATELRLEGGVFVARRPQYAGKALCEAVVRNSPALFTIRPNAFSAEAGGAAAGAVRALDVPVDPVEQATRVVGSEAGGAATVNLSEAMRIVSGGRSVRSKENFDALIRPLAAAAGAAPGASRAAVDAGYAPHSEQVGQTGKVVNPALYIACGISGAIQHLAGMRSSKVIVAINKDPEAPIFGLATYGIHGDIFEICPLLTAEIKATAG